MHEIIEPRERTSRPQSLYEYDEQIWRDRFPTEPDIREGETYEDYEPAYRYGVRLRSEYDEFEPNEDLMRAGWHQERGASPLDWERARGPVRVAWFQDREFANARPEEMLTPGKNA